MTDHDPARNGLLLAEDVELAATALPWAEPDVEVVIWDGAGSPTTRLSRYDAVSIAGYSDGPTRLRAALEVGWSLTDEPTVRVGAARAPSSIDDPEWSAALSDVHVELGEEDRPWLTRSGSSAADGARTGAVVAGLLAGLASAGAVRSSHLSPAETPTPRTARPDRTAPARTPSSDDAGPPPRTFAAAVSRQRVRRLMVPAAGALAVAALCAGLAGWLGDAVLGALLGVALVVSLGSLARAERHARRVGGRLRALEREVSDVRSGGKRKGADVARPVEALSADVAALRRDLSTQRLSAVEAAETLHRIESRIRSIEVAAPDR